ncbi:Hypothetical_protein [Hexamita inflata]|uniref:Hypothetical_protein n=1 Tax=Hexamita inflata TaxID=28002 RepID=A0AA86PS21_9EUKA|nr:Hypothetical protein HINF_LOCUS27669 [Hexamita inflata]CAI9943731.1 Hypothetical protein HINF_LOCUS31376 [Hexamita inflata]
MSLDKYVDQIELKYLQQLPNMVVTDEQIEEIEIQVGFKYAAKENKTENIRDVMIQGKISNYDIEEHKDETVNIEYNSILDDFNYKPITNNNIPVNTADIDDEFGYKKQNVSTNNIEQNDDFAFKQPFVAKQQETQFDAIQIQPKQQKQNQILDDFGYQIADVEDDFSYKPLYAKQDQQVNNNQSAQSQDIKDVSDVDDFSYKPQYAKQSNQINQNVDISPVQNENDDFSYKPLNAKKTNQNNNSKPNQLMDSPENDFERKNEELEQFTFKPFVKKEQTFKPVIQNDSLEDFTPFKATQVVSVPVKKNATVKATKAKGGFVCCARPDYD